MKQQVRFIGVAGTAGAGKDTASDILCRLFGLKNLSTSDMVRAITRQVYGLPHDFNPIRDQLYIVANYLRNEINPAAMVKLCVLQAQAQNLKGGVISGLRSMGEADAVRAAGGIIVGLDADPKVRYERIYSRQRDAESQKTYEQFLEYDAYENRGLSDSGAGRGIRTIIDTADVIITNAGSLEALEQVLKDKVGPLLEK